MSGQVAGGTQVAATQLAEPAQEACPIRRLADRIKDAGATQEAGPTACPTGLEDPAKDASPTGLVAGRTKLAGRLRLRNNEGRVCGTLEALEPIRW